MKKTFIILNVVTLISVIVLYILYFTNNNSETNVDLKMPVASSSNSIAFVNTDSLWKKYDFVIDYKAKLEEIDKQLQNQYSARIAAFQNEYNSFEKEFNEYLQKGSTMTLDQQKAREAELGHKKAQLEQRQHAMIDLDKELSQKLINEEQKMNNELQDTIHAFISRFNKKAKFSYILGYSKGAGILFANDTFDITQPIIDGLNKEYKNFKK